MRIILLLLIPVLASAEYTAEQQEIMGSENKSARYLRGTSPGFGEKFDLEYLYGGSDLMRRVPNIRWTFVYMSRKPMREEEAADLACRFFSHIIEEIGRNKDHRISFNQDLNATQLDSTRVALRIFFWDKDYNRYYPPHVAQVAIWNDSVHIYMADPATEELLEPSDYGSCRQK